MQPEHMRARSPPNRVLTQLCACVQLRGGRSAGLIEQATLAHKLTGEVKLPKRRVHELEFELREYRLNDRAALKRQPDFGSRIRAAMPADWAAPAPAISAAAQSTAETGAAAVAAVAVAKAWSAATANPTMGSLFNGLVKDVTVAEETDDWKVWDGVSMPPIYLHPLAPAVPFPHTSVP